MKSLRIALIIFLIAAPIILLVSQNKSVTWKSDPKINGVNFVSSRNPMSAKDAQSVVDVGSNYISIIPYAFIPGRQPEVIFDVPRQWYGERVEGTIQMIKQSREKNLKIMLKPHVWLGGWPSTEWRNQIDYKTDTEIDNWFKGYWNFLRGQVKIASSP